MNREREALAKYIQRVRKEKDLSLMDVRVNSGYSIATSYINRVENGEIANVSIEKLKALSKGLGVPETEIIRVATGANEPASSFDDKVRVMFYGFNELSKEDQEKTLEAVRMIAESMQRRRGAKKGKSAKQ